MKPLSEAGVGARVLLSFGLLVAAILAVGLVALNRVKLINSALQRVSASRLPKVELARTALLLHPEQPDHDGDLSSR